MSSRTAGPRTEVPGLIEADATHGWPDRFAAWADDRLTRVGLTSEFGRDCALAVLVFLVSTGLLLVLLADPEQTAGVRLEPFQMAAVFVVTSAQALLLCIRRVNPVLCLSMEALLQVALFPTLPASGAVRGIAPIIAAYSCGALLPVRRAAQVVMGIAVFESIGFAVVHYVPGLTMASQVAAGGPALPLMTAQLLSSAVSYLASTLVGAYVATRRQYVELVRVRAAEAIEAQRARADAAIGLERSRMARELHDIAAHHLSGMVVQASVVERLIDRDPQAAKEAAAWVRAQGKETLHNLRLVVGALREPGQGNAPDALGDGGAPTPGLSVLDRLVQTARELGTPVDLVQQGERKELAPIADITFYRVTQEALSNAREHAPGAPVRVLLRYRESEVALDVENEAAPTPDRAGPARAGHRGFGLAGMRERAQLIGATFDAGPPPSGGWRVSLSLPLDRETSSPHAGAHRSVPGPGTRLTT
jgi:signal transduction histidine kinase